MVDRQVKVRQNLWTEGEHEEVGMSHEELPAEALEARDERAMLQKGTIKKP